MAKYLCALVFLVVYLHSGVGSSFGNRGKETIEDEAALQELTSELDYLIKEEEAYVQDMRKIDLNRAKMEDKVDTSNSESRKAANVAEQEAEDNSKRSVDSEGTADFNSQRMTKKQSIRSAWKKFINKVKKFGKKIKNYFKKGKHNKGKPKNNNGKPKNNTGKPKNNTTEE